MRRSLALASLALLVAPAAMAQQSATTEAVRLAPGDVIRVEILSVQDPTAYAIQDDGAISGSLFGRVVVSGLTIAEAERRIKLSAEKYVQKPIIFVTLVQRKETFVTVVGIKNGSARIPWSKTLDLRAVISVSESPESVEKLEARVFRGGIEVTKVNVADLLKGNPLASNPSLEADDVVTITPVPMIRIWVMSRFGNPGEKLMVEGTRLNEVVAASGGPLLNPPGLLNTSDPDYLAQTKIRVTRGGQTFDFAPSDLDQMNRFVMQAGDTVSLSSPELMQVSIAGYVVESGVQTVLEGTDVLDVIVAARGPNILGTLENVLVLRGTAAYSVNLVDRYRGNPGDRFTLQNGDLVIVQENRREVTVLGDIRKPGKFLIKDGEPVRLADALAQAEGLQTNGTLRRIMIARRGEGNKIQVIEVNLDEFLKGGLAGSNPELQPGDFVLFSQSRGITADTFIRLLPVAVLLRSFGG
ncbi:MAG: polysaccharide biosynthesis/export family protein [Armatimonadetes bacterium]|nr:polysaccharide biosynthesis/export family protein [Armatimonadota bacterium]